MFRYLDPAGNFHALPAGSPVTLSYDILFTCASCNEGCICVYVLTCPPMRPCWRRSVYTASDCARELRAEWAGCGVVMFVVVAVCGPGRVPVGERHAGRGAGGAGVRRRGAAAGARHQARALALPLRVHEPRHHQPAAVAR